MPPIKKTLSRLTKNFDHLIHKQPCVLFGEIIITYHCPQKCLQCTIPQKAVNTNGISFEDFKLVVERLEAYGTQGLILSGGDPLSHPDHLQMLEYVSGKQFLHTHVLSTLYGKSAIVEPFIHSLIKNKISITCSFDGLGSIADQLRGAPNTAEIVWKYMLYLEKENHRHGYPIKTGTNIVISQLNLAQIPQIISQIETLGWTINLDLYRPQKKDPNDPLEINDIPLLKQTLIQAKMSKAVITPHWILDGYLPFLANNYPKLCPYLSSPCLGGKYFIQPDGQIQVCRGKKIGNLLENDLSQIFNSANWNEMLDDFEKCTGCWNTCYTPPAKISNYFNTDELKNILNTIVPRKQDR